MHICEIWNKNGIDHLIYKKKKKNRDTDLKNKRGFPGASKWVRWIGRLGSIYIHLILMHKTGNRWEPTV